MAILSVQFSAKEPGFKRMGPGEEINRRLRLKGHLRGGACSFGILCLLGVYRLPMHKLSKIGSGGVRVVIDSGYVRSLQERR